MSRSSPSPLHALLLVAALALPAVAADGALKEVRISVEGELLEVVVNVSAYDIVIDRFGIPLRVETGLGSQLTLKKTGMNQGTAGLESVDGRITYVDYARVAYTTVNSERVQSVGSLRLEYARVEGREDRMCKAGCLEFVYDYQTNRLERIGSLRLNYDDRTKRIDYVVDVSGTGKACPVPVRVLTPVSVFK